MVRVGAGTNSFCVCLERLPFFRATAVCMDLSLFRYLDKEAVLSVTATVQCAVWFCRIMIVSYLTLCLILSLQGRGTYSL